MSGIEAMLGLGFGENDEAQTRALASQLRSEQTMGDIMALSPTAQVQKLGSQMGRRANVQAQGAGNRRQEIKKALLAEKNRREQEKYDRSKLGKVESYTNPEGELVNVQLNDAGAPTFPKTMEGLTPYGKPSSRSGAGGGKVTSTLPIGGGVSVRVNDETSDFYIPGVGWTADQKELKDYRERVAGFKGDIKEQEGFGKGKSDWVNERVDNAYASAESARGLIPALNDVVASIDEGAKTGKLWNKLPTFTDATSRYESAISKLTLDNLTEYKLTPVSDKDLSVLRDAAFGDYTGETAKKYAQHKIKALELVATANEAAADYINSIQRRPNAADRKELRKIVDNIYGDYDFTFKGDKSEAEEPEPASTPAATAPMSFEDWEAAGEPSQ